jgi:hypothetical protein
MLMASVPGTAVAQQESARIQIETGTISPGEFYWYRFPDLKRGQILSVHLKGTSGNLDPIMGLADASTNPEVIEANHRNAIQQALIDGDDPLVAANEASDELFLIWNDDGGEGLSAAFTYAIPAEGDYQLVLTNALTDLGQATFGDYELAIGLDVPLESDLLDAQPAGDPIAFLDSQASFSGLVVEEFRGAITVEEIQETLEFHDLRVGDTIFAYVEATSGDLKPELTLLNYADKPLRIANTNGQSSNATLQYTIEDRGRGFAIRVLGCCDEESTSGDYRLVVGLNAPDVLDGDADQTTEGIIREPIPVAIGIKLQQIIEVDEQNEFFSAVASLQMEWDDPSLAFSPDECDCTFRTYTEKDFAQFQADTGDKWPEFTIFNQQGNRWIQNRVAVIWQNGHALYFERFSTNLQVDFDFRTYPFDSEDFVIKIDSIFPEHFYHFTDLEGYSEISAEHGEDEFQLGEFRTEITSEQASTKSTTSRFTFSFGGPRHLNYYVFQIFVPILLILGVLWVTFFLRDYRLRIEVAGANLFVFIAFSFSLADNYPRLGYLTLLDAAMVMTFSISTFVIVYNVFLRRLEMNGEEERANRIDNVFDWIYPITIISAMIFLYIVFF